MESNHLPEKPRVSVAVKIAIHLGLFLLSAWFYTTDLFFSVSRRLLYTLKSLVSLLFGRETKRRLITICLLLAFLVLLNYTLPIYRVYGQNGPVQSNYGIMGSFFGYPNRVTVGGSTNIYIGSSWCGASASAINGEASSGYAGGIFNLTGWRNAQTCPSADLTALDNAMINSGGSGKLVFPCPAQLYIPLQEFAPASLPVAPPVGAFVMPPSWSYEGCNPASVGDNLATKIVVGYAPDFPVTGTLAPQTRSYLISSTAITTAGGRTYMQVNSSNMDIVASEPVKINGGGTGANNQAIVMAARPCQVSSSVTITGYAPVGQVVTFTNTGTNGLAAGGGNWVQIAIAGITSQTVQVTSSADAQHFVATVTGAVAAFTSNGTATVGNTSSISDPNCPGNPGANAIFVPVPSGVTNLTFVAGTNYDSNAVIAFSGGGCLNQATGTVMVSGGSIVGVTLLTTGRGCTSAPTVTLTDTGCSGCSGGSVTAQVAATNMVCAATCNSIITADIPMFETVDFSGSNQVATMGQQLKHMIIDCSEQLGCEHFRSLGCNEHCGIEDINFVGMVDRAIDVHNKSTNGMDVIRGVRFLPGKQPNNPVTEGSGTITNSGTTVTSAAGTGFGFLASGSLKWATGTPIMVWNSGTLQRYYVSSVTNGTTLRTTSVITPTCGAPCPYIVSGVDAGTEAVFFGDGGPHGLREWTADFSGAPTSGNTISGAATAALQVPNCAIRVDTYNWAVEISDGHSEKSHGGVCVGLDAPARGVKVDTVWGSPNSYNNVVGPYQGDQAYGVKAFSDFWTNSPGSTPGTDDYVFINIVKNSMGITTNDGNLCSAPLPSTCVGLTLVDNNPIGPGLTPGPSYGDYVVGLHAVDATAVGGVFCQNVLDSGSYGNSGSCGNQHAAVLSSTLATNVGVGTTTLCAATSNACNMPGQYHIAVDAWQTVGCGTVGAGAITVAIGWTDPFGTAHPGVVMPLIVQTGATTTAVQTSMPFSAVGSLANTSAMGDFTVDTNGGVIQITIADTACTTAQGSYSVIATVSRLQ